ncbi:MAG TPA: methyltransferase [Acetobacteraceae bacterium]|nr:methyltransferase [Acetobacteraceae bacterium]
MATGAAAAAHASRLPLRHRLLASPRFQRWAAAFPLTRPVARRRARALFDLCAGFVYSQTLLAAVRLGLCEALMEGPQPLDQLAQRLSLPQDATARLLRASTALKLTDQRRDGRFALGSLGAALVGNPGIAAMVRHHALFYDDLRDPVALLRDEAGPLALRQLWQYAGHDRPQELLAEEVARYSDLMAGSLPLVAAELLAAYRFDRHRRLLDAGGGDGAFLSAVATAAPDLQLVLFDLPAVADRARARFAREGLARRARAEGGDLRTGRWPEGADIVSLVRVIHDHDDGAALAILRGARQALRAGGTLLLAEPMSETPGAAPVGAYFEFYLLAMGSGRPRTAAELEGLMRKAGFARVRSVGTRQPMLVQLLVGQC